MTRLRGEAGFTLVELLVTMTLMTVVFGLVLGSFTVFARQTESTQRQTDAQDEARQSVDRLAGRLRNAITTTNGALELSNASDLIFLGVKTAGSSTPTNLKGYVHSRYCLNTSTPTAEVLYRQSAAYTDSSPAVPATGGACPSTINGWGAAMPVATHLVNQNVVPIQPLFTYTYAAGGTSVTSVLIHTVVQADPTRARPGPSDLQTAVALRNSNQPPVAALSCQKASTGRVTCNASASADPDGQFLTFGWAVGGTTQQGEFSYRFSAGVRPTGTVITVTVTDGAGSSSAASYTVP
jgi:prepilin-type N-terminal cleavage/methylation domain-containing protein